MSMTGQTKENTVISRAAHDTNASPTRRIKSNSVLTIETLNKFCNDVNGRPQRDAKTPGPHLADWARQKKMLMYKTND